MVRRRVSQRVTEGRRLSQRVAESRGNARFAIDAWLFMCAPPCPAVGDLSPAERDPFGRAVHVGLPEMYLTLLGDSCVSCICSYLRRLKRWVAADVGVEGDKHVVYDHDAVRVVAAGDARVGGAEAVRVVLDINARDQLDVEKTLCTLVSLRPNMLELMVMLESASEVLPSLDLCTGCEARAGGCSHGFFSGPMARTREAARGRSGR